jgi:hypothetical protein
MRLGTFLMGGIVGAIAVTYLNRNNGMMMANLANAGQNVGNMVTKAKSKFSNTNMDRGSSSSFDNKSDNKTDNSNDHADFSRVKAILSKDPELKTKVDEILAENQNTSSTYKMQ